MADDLFLLEPHEVRFSQASTKNQFKEGGSIQELAQALIDGTVRAEDVLPIRIVRRAGKLFSLDNRRLEAFRRAGLAIRCRMATPDEVADESWKFTSTNDGATIRVRGE